MAEVTIRLFGVLRVDTRLACETVRAEKLGEIFPLLNEKAVKDASKEHPAPLSFNDAIIYINGERCSKKNRRLKDGDEIWLLSPASGG